jgi:vitamin B12 transporter
MALYFSPLVFILFFLIFSLARGESPQSFEIIALPLPSSPEETGGYESIITAQEIDAYQEIFLKDSLPYTPNVLLNSSGPQGRQVDFSIRGARSSQNLVLLNGVYINDPASGGGSDLSSFLNGDMERIEILAGPQTLAYGPGALGGVIQLIPKKGEGKPSLKTRAEGGSFSTRGGYITAQGEEGPLQFSTTLNGYGRGPASFTNPLHGNHQSDRSRNGTLSSRLGYALTDNWEVDAILRYTEAKTQLDEPQSSPSDGIYLPYKSHSFSETKILLTSLENHWGGERWDHSLQASYPRTQRTSWGKDFHTQTIGEHPYLLYKSSFHLNPNNTLTGGADLGQERAKEGSLSTRSHGGLYLIEGYKPTDYLEIKGGVRADHYKGIQTQATYNLGADYKANSNTLLRTSYGTNFKPPNLSDLFQHALPWQLPNPDLKPEKSRGLEVGVDQLFLCKKGKVSLTGFLNTIKDITLSQQTSLGQWQRYNGSKRIAKGGELAFSFTPFKSLTLKTAFTYTHAQDYPTGEESPFIPAFKGAGSLEWYALSDLSFFVQGYSVSSRKDSSTRRTLSPYGLLHVGGSYSVIKEASFFWRIENLTHTHYEEVFGYGSRGTAFFIGFEAKDVRL